jgi:4-hydroxy-tetrahydrodipicolinate reductase
MAEMKLVISGAAGRMGRALIQAIHANPETTVHGALERKGAGEIGEDAGLLAGIGELGIPVSDDALESLLDADGLVDFTTPAGSVELAGLAAQARIVHILGTTGLSDADDEKISAAARHATIVKSGNMSLGVNLLAVLVEQASRALSAEDFDIEILEMHHRNKVDAPSGTALLLGEAAAAGRGTDLATNSVRSRDGHTGARATGAIGFATLRGGSVVGEHSVLFSGAGEQITLSHSAMDRSIFARGAIHAALWARGRKPGLYSMRDVLGLAGR